MFINVADKVIRMIQHYSINVYQEILMHYYKKTQRRMESHSSKLKQLNCQCISWETKSDQNRSVVNKRGFFSKIKKNVQKATGTYFWNHRHSFKYPQCGQNFSTAIKVNNRRAADVTPDSQSRFAVIVF